MTDLESYESQLKEIQAAIKTCINDEEKLKTLRSLEADLTELINLCFLQELNEPDDKITKNEKNEDQQNYQHLVNQKCRAIFKNEYHNAFIAEIGEETADDGDILVKVFFLYPCYDKMKPCDFYLSGKCDFEFCKYSHGETIAFTNIRPYKLPNYKLLKRKCHVLAKSESLWKKGIVTEVCHDQKICKVKIQGKLQENCFSEVLPPDFDLSDDSDTESEPDSDRDRADDLVNHSNVFQIDDKFGEWEKFTTGFGSKMMEKLGYKKGEGLGKRGQGIFEPVSARIYIQGKSLDFNMEKNEKSRQKTVEEKIRKESFKQQKISEQNYSKKEDLFSFINSTIGKASTSKETQKVEDIRTQSKSQLNISNFKIEEDIKRRRKELEKINDTLKRQKSSSESMKALQNQAKHKQNEIDGLQRKLNNIRNEQKLRNEKSKLTIF